MKYLLVLSVSLILVLGNVARATSFDSDEATVKKSGAKSAKVTVDKKTYTIPVCFKDDASWDNVKDHYELSPASVSALKSGKSCLTVGADGAVSFCSPKGCKK